jgi:hypothetical protein
MYPGETFKMARKTTNFVYFACFSDKKTPFKCIKTYQLWSFDVSKKKFARHDI